MKHKIFGNYMSLAVHEWIFVTFTFTFIFVPPFLTELSWYFNKLINGWRLFSKTY